MAIQIPKFWFPDDRWWRYENLQTYRAYRLVVQRLAKRAGGAHRYLGRGRNVVPQHMQCNTLCRIIPSFKINAAVVTPLLCSLGALAFGTPGAGSANVVGTNSGYISFSWLLRIPWRFAIRVMVDVLSLLGLESPARLDTAASVEESDSLFSRHPSTLLLEWEDVVRNEGRVR